MQVKLNINDTIKFTLSESGADQLNQYQSETFQIIKCRHPIKINYKAGDEYSCQLWSFMEIFGRYMGCGLEAPCADCEVTVKN